MLPPASRLITGYVLVLKISPVLTTSDRRKKTMVSPSVCAEGASMVITDSPLKKISLSPSQKVTGGQDPSGVGAFLPEGALIRFSTFSEATIPAPRLLLPRLPATTGAPNFAIPSLPPVTSG